VYCKLHPLQFPWTIYIAEQPVTVHAICEAVAVFTAFRYYLYLKKKQRDTLTPNRRLAIVIAAALGAVLGGRLLGAAEDIPTWMAATAPWQYFFYNKTMVGGLLGGLMGVELVKKLMGERQHSGDLFVYPLIVGICIGRVGCFSAGVYEEAYGLPTTLPWGMDLGDGLSRHPVTLYEIGFLILLAGALKTLQRRYILKQGALFKLFMIAYLAFRLGLDVIKPGWRYMAGMGSIQLACIAGLLYYTRYILQPQLLINNTDNAGKKIHLL